MNRKPLRSAVYAMGIGFVLVTLAVLPNPEPTRDWILAQREQNLKSGSGQPTRNPMTPFADVMIADTGPSPSSPGSLPPSPGFLDTPGLEHPIDPATIAKFPTLPSELFPSQPEESVAEQVPDYPPLKVATRPNSEIYTDSTHAKAGTSPHIELGPLIDPNEAFAPGATLPAFPKSNEPGDFQPFPETQITSSWEGKLIALQKQIRRLEESGANPGQRLHVQPVTGISPDQRYTIEIQETDVREVLTTLGQLSQLNVVFGEGVQGTVSASLKDVTLDQALNAVLRSRNYRQEREDNILYIFTQEDGALKEPGTAATPQEIDQPQ